MGTLRKKTAHIVYYRVIPIIDSVKPEQMVFDIFDEPSGTFSTPRFRKNEDRIRVPLAMYYFFSAKVLFPFRLPWEKYYFLSVTYRSTISFPRPLKKYYFFSEWVHAPYPNCQEKYYFLSDTDRSTISFLQPLEKCYFFSAWAYAPFLNSQKKYYFLSESVEVLFLFRFDRTGSMNLGKIYLKVLFHFQTPPKCAISFPLITISFPRKHYFFSVSS
jgi:hypothetical protein